MALHRPAQRPSADPRAWWLYAFVLVAGHEVRRERWIDSVMTQLRLMRRYRLLVKRQQLQQLKAASADSRGADKSRGVISSTTSADDEVARIEEVLSMPILIRCRQQVRCC